VCVAYQCSKVAYLCAPTSCALSSEVMPLRSFALLCAILLLTRLQCCVVCLVWGVGCLWQATHLLELLLHASAPPLAPAAPASDKGTTPAAAAPSTSSTHSDAAGGEEMKDGEQGSGSSTEEFEKLSAQLAAWHHQALSAAPGISCQVCVYVCVCVHPCVYVFTCV